MGDALLSCCKPDTLLYLDHTAPFHQEKNGCLKNGALENHSNHRPSTGKKCLDLRAREKDKDGENGGRLYFGESQTT